MRHLTYPLTRPTGCRGPRAASSRPFSWARTRSCRSSSRSSWACSIRWRWSRALPRRAACSSRVTPASPSRGTRRCARPNPTWSPPHGSRRGCSPSCRSSAQRSWAHTTSSGPASSRSWAPPSPSSPSLARWSPSPSRTPRAPASATRRATASATGRRGTAASSAPAWSRRSSRSASPWCRPGCSRRSSPP